MDIIQKLKQVIEEINGYDLNDKRKTNEIVIGRMVFYILIKKYKLAKNAQRIFVRYTGRDRTVTYNIEKVHSYGSWTDYYYMLNKCDLAFKKAYLTKC